jgi:hypothetical protein
LLLWYSLASLENRLRYRAPFLIVQPYGRDVTREATVVRVCPTVEAAFDAVDTISERMRQTGAPSNAVELIVVDSNRKRVLRPGAH